MTYRITEVITWVKVDPKHLDLINVVLSAFGLAGMFALVALVLGVILGVTLICQRNRQRREAGQFSLKMSPT